MPSFWVWSWVLVIVLGVLVGLACAGSKRKESGFIAGLASTMVLAFFNIMALASYRGQPLTLDALEDGGLYNVISAIDSNNGTYLLIQGFWEEKPQLIRLGPNDPKFNKDKEFFWFYDRIGFVYGFDYPEENAFPAPTNSSGYTPM
ncbi:MAG: hypothetical protein HYT13_01945 [Candidatus Liptonbacteria bacterium]|nr:hypothetical protein [Candidatus Liptonbacteria bacterium]